MVLLVWGNDSQAKIHQRKRRMKSIPDNSPMVDTSRGNTKEAERREGLTQNKEGILGFSMDIVVGRVWAKPKIIE